MTTCADLIPTETDLSGAGGVTPRPVFSPPVPARSGSTRQTIARGHSSAVKGGLVRLPGDERRSACSIHAAALAGLILPFVGHVGGPMLVRKRMDVMSPALLQHYLTALAFNLWWGLMMLGGYLALWLLGWAVLPLVLLLAAVWAIQTAVVLARIEARRPARYFWYVDLTA
jgi:uncharacterized Tic20 family protein